MSSSALRPQHRTPETRVATRALIHRLGTHLVADESTVTNTGIEGETVSVVEAVLYRLSWGSLRVSLAFREDGSLFPSGTIATVRVVEGETLDEAVEVGMPRLSVSRNEFDRSQFDLRVDTGTVDPEHGHIFSDAVSVVNELIDRMTYADREV